MEENNLSSAATSATARAVSTTEQTTTERTVIGHVVEKREVYSGLSQRIQEEVQVVKPGTHLFTDAAYKTTTTSLAIGSSVVEHQPQQSNLSERHAASDVAAAPYVLVQEEDEQQLSVDDATSREAAAQNVADDAALQSQVPMDSNTVRLVPRVLDRLFSYVSLSDNVICLIVHWLLRSLVCPQRYNRLAAPKGNGQSLLLKWPLCFGDRQDIYPIHRQFRYIDLLRYNVSLQVPLAEVTKQVQVFLAGYEAMLLGEVYASAVNSRYKSLNTFIVDFRYGYRDDGADEQSVWWTKKSEYIMQRHNDKLAVGQRRGTCKERGICSKCIANDELFSGNWPQWAKTVTAITNSCGATLSNFVFTNDTFWGNSTLDVYKLRLPDEVYRTLNFDKILSGMPNLRTLHLPILDYELAFVVAGGLTPRCDYDQAARQKAWPVLRRMPSTEILPHLQRIVVQSVDHLLSRTVRYGESACGLPSLPRETEIMVEFYADTRYSEHRQNHIVFPAATSTIAHYSKSKLFSCLPTPYNWAIYRWKMFHKTGQQVRAEKLSAAIAAFVNDEASVRERQQRLSVLNSVRSRMPATTKAVIGVPVVDWIGTGIHNEFAFHEYEKHVADTISTLVGLMQTRRISPCDVKIRFEEKEFKDEKALLGESTELNSNWSWGCMRPLLPFFAVGNDDVSDAMLDSMRIDMVLHNFTTFGDKVEEWRAIATAQELRDGSERLLLVGQKYRIPNINLSVYNEVRVSAGNVTAEVCVKAIERHVLEKIRALLRDAVDSCARRDLSFYMYQSLKRVSYVFTVSLNVEDDANKQFREQADVLLNGRAAKFEQGLMREVFADVWKDDELGCSSSLLAVADEGCDAQLTSVLKLSALQSISSNIHIRIV